MKLFLDSSAVLAACLSSSGASRIVFDIAGSQRWRLMASPWVLREVRENLAGKPPSAAAAWVELRERLMIEGDELVFDWPLTFDVPKDKSVLLAALACADVLLTLDRRDFGPLIGQAVYGLLVFTPGQFLERERTAGRI